jgi:hypothetical protein
MLIMQHLWEFSLFLMIIIGPIPLCLSLAFGNQKENCNDSLPHFFAIVLTAWIIVQICTGLILGSLDRLNIVSIILAEFLIFAIASNLINYQERRNPASFNWQIPQLKQPLSKSELLMIGAATFVGCVLLENLATKPTTNYDSLWFYLPAIARWYQTGSFTLLDAAGNWIFEQEQARVYPYNWHVLSALCVIPFKSDFLAAFPMLIAWVIQGLSIYLLSIKFGASRFYSIAAASLVLTVPMMLNQVNTIHPDLPLSAIFTLGLYLGLSYYQSRSLSELALFLASTGLLAGMKITGLVYAAALLVGLAILEIKKIRVNQKYAQAQFRIIHFIKPVIICGITCFLFLGGFWYTRNLLQINYPIDDIGKIQIPLQPVPQPSPKKSPTPSIQPSPSPAKPPTPAIQPSPSPVPPPTPSIQKPPASPLLKIWQSTLAAQFNPSNIEHWQTLGLQIIIRLQIPFIAIALQVLAAPLAVTKGKTKLINQNNIILIVVLASTGILYLITPYTSGTAGESISYLSPLLGFNFRYGFPFLSLLGVAAAAIATLLKTRTAVICGVVLFSTISGIVSNTIFDIVKNSSFTGDRIVWGSWLIDNFKSHPQKTINIVWKILASNQQNLGIYPLLYIGLIISIALILFNKNPGSIFIRNLFASIQQSTYLMIIIVCIALILNASWVAREKRDIAHTKLYRGIYEYIDKTTVPNEKIGFFLSSRSYLFYGKDLNRQVLYVPFRADRLSAWIDNLRQNQVSIIGFGPLTETDANTKKALSWLTSAQGPLQPVFGKDFNTESVLYRLKN